LTPFEISFDEEIRLCVVGSGPVKLELNVQGNHKKCIIKNVSHITMLDYNLLFVSAIKVYDMGTLFASGKYSIKEKNNKIAVQGTWKGGICVLDTVRCAVFLFFLSRWFTG
jgi:hypothetical protein